MFPGVPNAVLRGLQGSYRLVWVIPKAPGRTRMYWTRSFEGPEHTRTLQEFQGYRKCWPHRGLGYTQAQAAPETPVDAGPAHTRALGEAELPGARAHPPAVLKVKISNQN